jgi:Ca-activated chloride channel homolog
LPDRSCRFDIDDNTVIRIVDAAEYRLQMGGLAAALRDGSVSDALVQAKAAILLVQWSGLGRQEVTLDWTRITSRADLTDLAQQIDAAPRAWRDYSTGIGEALAFTASTYGPVSECRRKVIDVSGDGPSNEGLAPEFMRASLVAQGFTVNALAIEGAVEDLTGYYRDHVIAGPGAFVVTANGFNDYPRRIRQKLLREVTKQIAAVER